MQAEHGEDCASAFRWNAADAEPSCVEPRIRWPCSRWHAVHSRVTLTSSARPASSIDQRRLERNIDRMQEAADAGGIRLRPHAKTHKSPDLALADRARRRRHLLREARRGGGVRRRAASPTSGCPIRSTRSTPTACSRCSIARASRSSSITSTSRAAGRRVMQRAGRAGRRPRQGRRRLSSLRHRSGHADARGLRRARRGAARAAASGPPQSRRPRLRRVVGAGARRRSPRREAELLTGAAGSGRGRRRGARGDQRRRDADGALQRAAARHHRAAAGQLRLLRPHAGRRSAPPTWDDCALTVLARVVSRPTATASSSTPAARR